MTRPAGGLWADVRRRPAPLVLVVLLAAFVVQEGVTRLDAEPYPALAAPGFRGTGVGAGTIVLERPRALITDRSGAVVPVSAAALFDTPLLAESLARSAFSLGLAPDGLPEQPRGQDVRGLLAPVRAETPGWTRDGSSPRAFAPDTVAWLRTRATALLPPGSAAAASVTLVWERFTYLSEDPDRPPAEELLQRVVVDL